MSGVIEVLDPGLLTTVQDAGGRTGWRRYGVGVGGAADTFSARLANRQVGNPETAALLEATMVGPALRFTDASVIAIAGADLAPTVDGRPVPMLVAVHVVAGARLVFGERRHGARAYLAVRGGLDVPAVLGSPATDQRSGFGGLEGRALRAGDRLGVGTSTSGPLLHVTLKRDSGPIRILDGPHAALVGADAVARLCDGAWTVSGEADRAGVRLDGAAFVGGRSAVAEIESTGVPLGAVQLPPDGRPIVMLADRPVTGGYPFVACVTRVDVGRVAQLLPGDPVTFRLVDRAEAVAAIVAWQRSLDEMVPMGSNGESAEWAGALD